MSLQGWGRKTVWCSIFTVAAVASYAGVNLAVHSWERSVMPARTDGVTEAGPVSRVPYNPFALDNGTHLIAFVVTASDCGWSTRPEGMAAIRTLRTQLNTLHGSSYTRVSVIGVAIDKNPDVGLQFLTRIGKGQVANAFDQVVVGGSWLNEEIVRFVWRERVANAISPQLIVIERRVDTERYSATATIAVEQDRVVATAAGHSQILAWLKRGGPLGTTEGVAPVAAAGGAAGS